MNSFQLLTFLLFTKTTTAGTELEGSVPAANLLSLIMLLIPAVIIVRRLRAGT